jgi:hypothetical protein
VLDWVFMFDDDKSVLAFLDHARKRFGKFPDAKKPFPAERYMNFPSQKLADIEDNGKVVPIVERHPEGESCPAKPRVQQGTIIARVFGRALDKHGKPVADTVRQENYVEDRFNVPVVRQEALAKALAAAGTERFKIADDLARVLVSHAFMGELDVNPFGDINGSKAQRTDCTFWGQKVQADGNGPVRVHIDGKSEVAGVAGEGQNSDGPLWQHQVKLAWEGLIEMKGNRITRLLLVASGTEKLKRGNKNAELGHQPGGHVAFIDLDCGVRYGIIGEPVRFDIGMTTRNALSNFVANEDALVSGDTSERASGNGSIMRLAPVPIRYAELYPTKIGELSRLAEESSLPTHASEQCLSACRYLATALAANRWGRPWSRSFPGLEAAATW